MLAFPMASQSQPPSTSHHTPGSRTPGPHLALSSSSRSYPPCNPFAISHFRTPLSHAAPVSHEKSAACAYFLSPRGCAPCPEQKQEDPVQASRVNPSFFSNLQPLSASLPSFSSPRPLFSATYSLFFENTRVGVVLYCGLLESTLSHCQLPGFCASLRRSKRMARNPRADGDRDTVTSRTFVAAAGVVLGFALQDAARAAQVLALLTSSRSRSAQSSTWRGKLAATQAEGRGKSGFSLRSQGHIRRVQRAA
jgi:hypothetical protein